MHFQTFAPNYDNITVMLRCKLRDLEKSFGLLRTVSII